MEDFGAIALLNKHLLTLEFPANTEEAFIYFREMVLNGITTNRDWLITSYIFFENESTFESRLKPADEAKLLIVLSHHLSLPEAVPSNCTKVLIALFERFEWTKTSMRLRLVTGLVKAAVDNAVPTLLNALAMLIQKNFMTSPLAGIIAEFLFYGYIIYHPEVCKEILRLPLISKSFCTTMLGVFAHIYLFKKKFDFEEPHESLLNLVETWLEEHPILCTRLTFLQNVTSYAANRYAKPFGSLLCWTVLGPLIPLSSFERYRKLHEILLKSIRETKYHNVHYVFYTNEFLQAANYLKTRTDYIKATTRQKNAKLTMKDYYKHQKCLAFITNTAMEVINLKCTLSGDQTIMLNRFRELEAHYTNFFEFERLYL